MKYQPFCHKDGNLGTPVETKAEARKIAELHQDKNKSHKVGVFPITDKGVNLKFIPLLDLEIDKP